MSRSGLARFGVVPSTIVRTPARDRDGLVICPECGVPVGSSKGTPTIVNPDLRDRELTKIIGRELVTHGWQCTSHQYDVVIPSKCHGPDAPSFVSGWMGVQIYFADEVVRWVATPEKEIKIAQERAAESDQGGESDGV